MDNFFGGKPQRKVTKKKASKKKSIKKKMSAKGDPHDLRAMGKKKKATKKKTTKKMSAKGDDPHEIIGFGKKKTTKKTTKKVAGKRITWAKKKTTKKTTTKKGGNIFSDMLSAVSNIPAVLPLLAMGGKDTPVQKYMKKIEKSLKTRNSKLEGALEEFEDVVNENSTLTRKKKAQVISYWRKEAKDYAKIKKIEAEIYAIDEVIHGLHNVDINSKIIKPLVESDDDDDDEDD